MDTNILINSEQLAVNNSFTITIELFEIWDTELKVYEVDVHIWWENWALWTTKAVWLNITDAEERFNEFGEIAKNIKTIFEK